MATRATPSQPGPQATVCLAYLVAPPTQHNCLVADWWIFSAGSDLTDELLPDFGLVVELRQHRVQQLPDQTGLVVGRRVERDQRHATHVQVGVFQGL